MNYILVAEDDLETQDVFNTILNLEGYEVVCVSNGAEALELISSAQPSLILLDLQMPVMDGVTFLNIYQKGALPQVPVVIVSAKDSRTTRIDGPVYQYLRKPFDMPLLLTYIRDTMTTH